MLCGWSGQKRVEERKKDRIASKYPTALWVLSEMVGRMKTVKKYTHVSINFVGSHTQHTSQSTVKKYKVWIIYLVRRSPFIHSADLRLLFNRILDCQHLSIYIERSRRRERMRIETFYTNCENVNTFNCRIFFSHPNFVVSLVLGCLWIGREKKEMSWNERETFPSPSHWLEQRARWCWRWWNAQMKRQRRKIDSIVACHNEQRKHVTVPARSCSSLCTG